MYNNLLSLHNRREHRISSVVQTVIYFIYVFFDSQGKIHPVIPFAVMSAFAFIAGCLCALLPETLGKPTPETFIEDISETNYQHNLNDSEQPLSCTSLESDSR